MARCSVDIVYWCNNWVWTYDPRLKPSTLPFDLYDIQARCLRWLADLDTDQVPGLIEKSRDMGATWLCCAFADWCWLFKPGDATGFGSRKLELVDRKGDQYCIFDKIRFIIQNLPAWMRPAGFLSRRDDTTGKIINPANGSTITGEGGDQIGRGGRKSRYFVDEAAFLERPDLVDRSLIATTEVRIDVSTPNGPGNPFATRRDSGNVRVFTLHYRDDPRKTAAWIEAKKPVTDPVTWAQEYEIDYSASVEGIAIPGRFVQAAIDLLTNPKFIAAYPEYVPHGDLRAGLDIAGGGKNSTVLTPRRAIAVMMPVDEPFKGLGTTDVAELVCVECEQRQIRSLAYDVNGIGISVQDAWTVRQRTRPLPMGVSPVNSSASPSDDIWPTGKTSKEMFRNLRSELWWKMRSRFERTYEFVVEGKLHDPNTLISIPRCPALIKQLSTPLSFRTETGLIYIESKEAMAKRGIQSPDYADSLIYSEYAMSAPDWSAFSRGRQTDVAPPGIKVRATGGRSIW